MGYKIAFFDIDNTIYDWKNRCMVPSGIEAMKRLKKEGVLVVLSTARPYHSAKRFGVFELGVKFDGFLGSAGGIAIYHNKVIYKQTIDHKTLRKLCKTVISLGLTAEVVTPKNRFLVAPPTDSLERYHLVYSEVVPPVHPYYNEDATGLLLHSTSEYDEFFQKEFPSIYFHRYHECGVDVMSAPRNKGEVMLVLLKYLGLTKEDAIAFGDDFQDIAMGQAAKFVCMGNGHPDVKASADEVTEEIWNDGLAKAIARNFGW